MRVLITSDNQRLIPNYLCINPFTAELSPYLAQHCQVIQHDAGNICDLVDNGELEELRLEYILDFFPLQNIPDVLRYYAAKLAYGGELVINGTDSLELARVYYQGGVTLERYNELNRPTKLTLSYLKDRLKECGLQTVIQRFDPTNYSYSLKMRRPSFSS